MKIIILTLVILLSSFSPSSSGESVELPPHREGRITVPPTLKTDPIHEITIGNFKAKFEETTLSEILKAVGVGTIQYNRDDGVGQYWLCYSLPHQRVWFISNELMSGSEYELTQVQAVSIKPTSIVNASCPQIPPRFQTISMNFGWIGSSQETLVKVLGQPSGKNDGHFQYLYEGNESGMYQGQKVEFDVLGFIDATIVNNKISSVYVSHVTSY